MKFEWMPFRIKNIFKDGKTVNYHNILILLSIIFAIFFSFYSILKAYTLNAYAWDLGLYSQAFYSSMHGQLFYSNLLGESYLAEHFSPFMFALLGVFYIYPNPYILLIIQAVFLSFATIPLYYISLHIFSRIKEKYPENIKNPSFYSFIIASAFLLSPLTESPIYFDFHLMIFLPFFYFMAIYFYIKNRMAWNIVFLALIVSLHASFVFIVVMTLIMEMMISRYYFKESGERTKKMAYLFITSLIVLLIYYTVAGYLKGDIAHSQSILLFASGATDSASKSITGLVLTFFLHPYRFMTYIIANYQIKLLFLVLAFLAVDFAFYRFPIGLIPAIPYLVYAMTSSYVPYYFIGYQYSMMFIPMIFVAAVFGISKMMEFKPTPSIKTKRAYRNLKNTMVVIAIFAIAAFIVVSPISPVSLEPSGIHNIVNDSTGYSAQRNHLVYSLENNISMNSSLVTGNNIYPLFYKDLNATAFPYNNISSPSVHFKYLIADLNDSQTYIENAYNISLANLASDYMNSGSYGILAEGYGVIALELHYTGKPLIFNPLNISYSSKEFDHNNGKVYGPIPDKNMSSFQELENLGADVFSGNTTYLLPGNYSISVYLNSSYKIPASGINITILDNGRVSLYTINSSSYRLNGETLTFNVNSTEIYTGVTYVFTGVPSINGMSIMQNYV